MREAARRLPVSLPVLTSDRDASGNGSLLSARSLGFSAGGRRLLEDVSLDVGVRRRLVIMGANGAGKSLLLRILNGLVAPASGAVFWQGRRLDRAARRAQAMVFQRPVLLRRSVAGNLRFALAARGVPAAERPRRLAAALQTAGLADLAGAPARRLSGGEQQRLALACALAGAPRLLLLDEPTASLDPAATQAIEALIATGHEAGIGVVLVTHDAGQARRLGDDIAFLHGGRLVEYGPASRVLEAPQSEAAQAWLEGRLFLGA